MGEKSGEYKVFSKDFRTNCLILKRKPIALFSIRR